MNLVLPVLYIALIQTAGRALPVRRCSSPVLCIAIIQTTLEAI